MRKIFVALLAIIAIAIVVCYEAAPKEEGYFIKNHYVDPVENYGILTTVSNNNDYSSISSSTLILIDEDSITIENTRSNDTQ